MSCFEPAKIVARLETLIGREHVCEDYVRFRIALVQAQTAVCHALARPVTPPVEKTADAKQGAAVPPFGADRVSMDRALLSGLFERLLAALGHGGRPRQHVARLSAAADADTDLLEQLARKAAFGPDEAFLSSLSGRLGISLDGLLLFGRVLAAPFVTWAVRRAGHADAMRSKASGHCPLCSSPPGLAELNREDGRRVLCCSLCGHRWQFARVHCPFCGSENDLEAISIQEDDCRWIETCGDCRGYLKTVDVRKLPQGEVVVPLVETTATVYLDLIAEKEGCHPAVPYAAMS